MTAEELYGLLQRRYCLPEYGLFRQVTEAGTGGARYADAIAMNLFKSRGLEVHGFEIKVSRGDWLRELKDPAKADALSRFADRWWIVAGEDLGVSGTEQLALTANKGRRRKAMVEPGELPPGWGLLVPRAGTLYTAVPAEKREAEPLSREFISTLLRRAMGDEKFSYETQVRRACAEAVKEAQAEWEKERGRLEANVDLFEEHSGLHIPRSKPGDAWTAEYLRKMGRAVKLVMEGRNERDELRRDMRWVQGRLRSALATVDELLKGEAEEKAADKAAGEG